MEQGYRRGYGDGHTTVLVTVTLSPREQSFTYTDITIEWSDPDGCDSHYFVGLYRDETVMRNLGFHPAPATTTLSRELRLPWDRIPATTGQRV